MFAQLLPHFLRMRGLMRQHIDSFNHLIKTEIRNIVTARSNVEVRSEADPKFFLRYTVSVQPNSLYCCCLATL